MDKEYIKCIANDNGWEFLFEHVFPMVPLLRFGKKKIMIDIWFTTGTVGIMRRHKKTEYIRNCNLETCTSILINKK